MNKKLSTIMMMGLALSISSAASVSAQVWNGSISGDWNTAANWTPSVVPANGTDASFSDATALNKTVAVPTDTNALGSFTVSAAGYTLTTAGVGVDISLGNLTSSVAFTLASSSTGNLSYATGNITAGVNAITLTGAGNVTATGLSTVSGGALNVTSSNNGNISLAGLALSGGDANLSVTAGTGLITTGNVSISNADSDFVLIGADSGATIASITQSAGTANLTAAGTGNIAFTGNQTLSGGNLTVALTSTGDLVAGANTVVSGGQLLVTSSANGNIGFANLTLSGGDANLSVTLGSGVVTTGNLVINDANSEFVLRARDGDASITSITQSAGTANLTAAGTGNINVTGNQTLSGGNLTVALNSTGDLVAGANTVVSGGQLLVTSSAGGNIDFANLTLSGGDANLSVTAGTGEIGAGNVVINNSSSDFVLSTGSGAGAAQIGSYTQTAGTGNLTANNGNITFNLQPQVTGSVLTVNKAGSGNVVFVAGISSNNANVTVNGSGGAGNIYLQGAAATTNNGTINFNLSGGTGDLVLDNAASNLAAATVTTTSGADIVIGSGPTAITNVSTGVISGSGMIVYTAASGSTFSGNNTFTGGVKFNAAGEFRAGHDNAAGTGAFDLSTSSATISTTTGAFTRTLANNITLGANILTVDTTNANIVLNGIASGTGGITLTGATVKSLTLNGNNNYTGATTLNGVNATLIAGHANALGTGAGGLLFQQTGIFKTSLSGGYTFLDNISVNAGVAAKLDSSGGNLTIPTIISGGGAVTYIGGGIITLSGANSYAGGSAVGEGTTVELNNANALGAVGVPVQFQGNGTFTTNLPTYIFANSIDISANQVATLDTTTGNFVVPQVISGANGSLTKAGTGVLTLSAPNTATGTLAVNAGTLALVDSGKINTFTNLSVASGAEIDATGMTSGVNLSVNNLSGAGDILLGTRNFQNTQAPATTTTYSGSISGTGNAIFAGTGALVLEGANAWTGTTSITGTGGLFLNNAEALSAGAVSISAATTLRVLSSMTIANDISSTSSYTLGASSGVVATFSGLNDMLAIDRTITKTGSGEIVLNNSGNFATYSPTFLISEGTLTQAANGAVGNNSITINGAGAQFKTGASVSSVANSFSIGADGGALYTANNTTYTGTIAVGANALTVTGAAGSTTTFSAPVAITTTGGATINFGDGLTRNTIVVNTTAGSAGTPTFNVTNNAILKGTGTCNGNVVAQPGSTIAPGQSIGTIVINGNYTQQGTYECEINNIGQSDKIIVNGLATLGGTLALIRDTSVPSLDGYYIHDAYTVLTASSYAGNTAFAAVDQGAIRRFTVGTANSSLVYQQGSGSVQVDLGEGLLSSAQTSNEYAFFQGLVDLVAPNESQQALINRLLETTGSVSGLTGEQYGDLMLANSATSMHFINAIYNPLRQYLASPCGFDSCQSQAWFDVAAIGSNYSSDSSAYGFSSGGFNLAGGIQAPISHDLVVGAGLFYEYNSFSLKSGGSATGDTVMGGVYALYRPKSYYVFADLNGGYNFQNVSRNAFGFSNKATPGAGLVTFYAEFGKDFYNSNNCFLLQPFVGVNVTYSNWSAFNESGDSATALYGNGRSYTEATSRLGAHLYTVNCGDTLLGIDADWACRLTDRYDYRNVGLAGTSDVYGTNLSRNSFEGAVYVSKQLNCHWKAYVEGTTRIWSRAIEGSILAGVSYNW